jgi:hypothetical protein
MAAAAHIPAWCALPGHEIRALITIAETGEKIATQRQTARMGQPTLARLRTSGAEAEVCSGGLVTSSGRPGQDPLTKPARSPRAR